MDGDTAVAMSRWSAPVSIGSTYRGITGNGLARPESPSPDNECRRSACSSVASVEIGKIPVEEEVFFRRFRGNRQIPVGASNISPINSALISIERVAPCGRQTDGQRGTGRYPAIRGECVHMLKPILTTLFDVDRMARMPLLAQPPEQLHFRRARPGLGRGGPRRQ